MKNANEIEKNYGTGMIKMIKETDIEIINNIIKDDVCCSCEDEYCAEKKEFLERMLKDAKDCDLRTDQLEDTLYNCSIEVTQTTGKPNYATGILVGAIGTTMTLKSATFEEAVEYIKEFLPKDFDETIVPSRWKPEFKKHETEKVNEDTRKEIIECKETITKLLVKRNELLKEYNDLKKENTRNKKLLEDIKAVLK